MSAKDIPSKIGEDTHAAHAQTHMDIVGTRGKISTKRSCQICTTRKSEEPHWSVHTANKGRRLLAGDNLMQCLDCSFVGCSPKTLCNDSRQHMLQHLLISGHQFGENEKAACVVLASDVVFAHIRLS